MYDVIDASNKTITCTNTVFFLIISLHPIFLSPVSASCLVRTWLAIDRSICILTRPVVITGFNRSLLVDWWSIGRLKKNMVDVKILSISYFILLDSINRLKIVSI